MPVNVPFCYKEGGLRGPRNLLPRREERRAVASPDPHVARQTLSCIKPTAWPSWEGSRATEEGETHEEQRFTIIQLLLIICLLCARHFPSRNLSSEQGMLTSKQMTRKDESEFCNGRRVREQHMQS